MNTNKQTWVQCGECSKRFSTPEYPAPAEALRQHYDLGLCPGPRKTQEVTVRL